MAGEETDRDRFGLGRLGVDPITRAVAEKALDIAIDLTYIGVGFGVLAYQRAQVWRRSLEESR